ncbi:MAG: prephenate dehydratase [Gammaproteobacteria bacterium]|nr:prephenate dehydratase [Gammaproteobacteria bacterium]
MGSNQTLDELRARIDAVDDQLLKLISERAGLAVAVGAAKARESGDTTFYRPEREAQKLRRIQADNPGPLADAEVARLIREIMSSCLALEQPLTIAYLGPPGTFTHAAAAKQFGGAVTLTPTASIDEVFRKVETGQANYGVVPVENSTEGVVPQTLDRLRESTLSVCGETMLAVHHLLLSKAPDIGAVERVLAHPQAIAQCRRWLDRELPGVERVAVSSNGEGARQAAEDPNAAAIASSTAAELYGLEALAENIEDSAHNTTRFLVLAGRAPGPSGNDKTSLMFTMRNEPGALYGALQVFADAGVSMSRIESRPSDSARWEYYFYIDIEGHGDDPVVAEALACLEERVALLRVFGSYPCAAH